MRIWRGKYAIPPRPDNDHPIAQSYWHQQCAAAYGNRAFILAIIGAVLGITAIILNAMGY